MPITWDDKVTADPKPAIPEINKVTDADMNEIKDVVNTNETALDLKAEQGGNDSPLFSNEVVETFSATIELDFEGRDNYTVTVTGTILINAINFNDGQVPVITIIMDNTGGHAVTLGTMFKATDDVKAIDNAADKVNIITCKSLVAGTILGYTNTPLTV